MSIRKIILLIITVCLVFAANTSANILKIIPSDTLAYIHIKNANKTVDAFDDFNSTNPENEKNKISFAKTIGKDLFKNNKVSTKQDLESEFGLNLNGEIAVILNSTDFKLSVLAYQVNDREKVLNKMRKEMQELKSPENIYNNVQVYMFEEEYVNQKKMMNINQPSKVLKKICYVFFVDNYIVKAFDENSVHKIIDTYNGKSPSIILTEKFKNTDKSLRHFDLIVYINFENVVKKTMPLLKIMGPMFINQAVQNHFKNSGKDHSRDQIIIKNIMGYIEWGLLQLESAGFSIQPGKDGILIDSYVGFKKDSPLQEYLGYKNTDLAHTDILPEKSFFSYNSKVNSAVYRNLYHNVFAKFDTSLLMMSKDELDKIKKPILDEIDSITSLIGNELSTSIIPEEKETSLSLLYIIDILEQKKSEDMLKKIIKYNNTFKVLSESFSGEKKADNKKDELKPKDVVEYKKIKINSYEIKGAELGFLGADLLDKDNNGYLLWNAIVKNKSILLISKSDVIIKKIIDRLMDAEADKSVIANNKTYLDVEKMLQKNPDRVAYLSVNALSKILVKYYNKHDQSECLKIMEEIDTASSKYIVETKKQPKSLQDLYAGRKLNRADIIKKGDEYTIDGTTGRVSCKKHGSLSDPVPLKKIDSSISQYITLLKNDGMGISTKDQNFGLSSSFYISSDIIHFFANISKNAFKQSAAKPYRVK